MREIKKGLTLLKMDKKLLALFIALVADTVILVSILTISVVGY